MEEKNNKSNKSFNKSNKSSLNTDKSDLSDLKRFNDIYLPVCEITPNGQGNIQTVLTLVNAILDMGKIYLWAQSTAPHIDLARNRTLEILKTVVEKTGSNENIVRGFIIDADIYCSPSNIENIIKNIEMADKEDYSFVVPYRVNDDTSLIKPDGLKVTIGELKEYNTGDGIYAAGLGFYYGDLVLNHKFYFNHLSEDINYIRDNKIDLRIVKDIEIYHTKPVHLGINENRYM